MSENTDADSARLHSSGNTAFDRFLKVAADKPFQQKLLLVFAEKELRPETRLSSSESGDFAVNPLMYTDKQLHDVKGFNQLLSDSLTNGQPWDLLFVAALDAEKFPPEIVEQRLEAMVKMIQQGESERFLIFNGLGELAHLAKVAEQ